MRLEFIHLILWNPARSNCSFLDSEMGSSMENQKTLELLVYPVSERHLEPWGLKYNPVTSFGSAPHNIK